MKVALIHDSLVEYGGSERILQNLLEMFPQADLFTAFHRHDFVHRFLSQHPPKKLYTSVLQSLPIEHHTSLIQSIAPILWRQYSLANYDLVISHGNHLMSSLVRVPCGVHVTYVPSPPKNITGFAPPTLLQRLTGYDKIVGPRYLSSLRAIYYVATNSKHTQSMLKTLGVTSTVIYPPVTVPPRIPKRTKGRYFVTVSRIDPTKELETAILAANNLRAPLKIVGLTNTPSYEAYLRRLAGPTIQFLGFRNDRYIAKLYENAIAFIFPSRSEDFGIAPLEATAHGVPVIAYHGGGARETIVEGKTGTFFHRYTAHALQQSMGQITSMQFDPHILHHHAETFSTKRFRREFIRYVNNAIKSARSDISGKIG